MKEVAEAIVEEEVQDVKRVAQGGEEGVDKGAGGVAGEENHEPQLG